MTQHEILNRLFLEAAGDLLSANGIKAEVVTELGADVHSKLSYVSVLGATGEGVALSSMMTVDSALLVSLHPLGITEIPTADLEDWCSLFFNSWDG